MKRTFAILLTVSFLFSMVSAQEVTPAVSAGSKSLNFTFAGLGAFGVGASGISGGLGASYFLSRDAAVRIGLQVVNASAKNPANPAPAQTGTDGEQSAFSVGVGADYLMYMTGLTARVRPYVGAGVLFRTTSTSRKDVVIAPTIQTETKNRVAGEFINGTTYLAGTSFGAVGIVGAEFFLYREISLSAEYQLNLITSTSAADQEATQGSTTVTVKGGSTLQILGFGAAGATLHIYF